MTTSSERAKDMQEAIEADLHRPQYHFLPPRAWMNDPNGLIQWKGTYHLFYQFNPHGAWHDTIHWGHATSMDLVHWTDLPIALAPTPGSPDQDGCYSGCAVDDNGVPTIIYTGVRGEQQLPCLATSDDDLRTWHKYPGNPIIACPPPDAGILMFRDHAVWNEAGVWYQLIGSGIKDRGGAALLYRSDDLRHWEYLHPLCVGDQDRTHPVWTGPMWECPDFFALGDRFVLIISVHSGQSTVHTAYFLGRYEQHRFLPQREGLLDFGSSFYAPQSVKDSQGRRILWGWLREQRSVAEQVAAGWSGVMSLPRILSLSSAGTLMMRPAPELQILRRDHHHFSDLIVDQLELQILEGVHGTALEIIAELEPSGAYVVGLSLCRSPDGAEETRILYDCTRRSLAIDTRRASLDGDVDIPVRWGEVTLSREGSLCLHIFLDHSVVEVFAQDSACTTARIYPTRHDSDTIALFAKGGSARVRSMEIWEMASIWDERAAPQSMEQQGTLGGRSV